MVSKGWPTSWLTGMPSEYPRIFPHLLCSIQSFTVFSTGTSMQYSKPYCLSTLDTNTAEPVPKATPSGLPKPHVLM